LSTLFIPQAGPQTGQILHMRKALQADEIGTFVGAFLWLAHSFSDLYISGMMGSERLPYMILGLVASLCVGPGAALALDWYLREGILENVTAA